MLFALIVQCDVTKIILNIFFWLSNQNVTNFFKLNYSMYFRSLSNRQTSKFSKRHLIGGSPMKKTSVLKAMKK